MNLYKYPACDLIREIKNREKFSTQIESTRKKTLTWPWAQELLHIGEDFIPNKKNLLVPSDQSLTFGI
jgi:hypothetical protein